MTVTSCSDCCTIYSICYFCSAGGSTVSSTLISPPEAYMGFTPNNLSGTTAKTTTASTILSLGLSWFGKFAFPKYKHNNMKTWTVHYRHDFGNYCSYFNCGQ
ncbi:hypothetical protein HPG69_006523 [Diceros bicornis minor]|uniref:Uncharacterized protein n=1 Tax=Diceros bicornis minor TaxID=77932 RepID=A0A7J7F6I6_DICBM|nr:hypothetical protein HPG69_006523 [Diceros bicornis minor]